MSIARNLAEIQARVERACALVKRHPSEVTLIAVSKTVEIDRIWEAYDAGHRHFGESRLQEAMPKIEALPADITWHFIGNLQSNKARRIAECFAVIHTLDSQSQLREIAKANRQIQGFIEVNIANEPQKAGISLNLLDEFRSVVLSYPQVHLNGLMMIGPAVDDPELSRPYFRDLRELSRRFGDQSISMGMSQDFDVAVQEGSTHIRVGSAIFGSRA